METHQYRRYMQEDYEVYMYVVNLGRTKKRQTCVFQEIAGVLSRNKTAS